LQIFDSGSREPGKTWENIAEQRILTAPASSFAASDIFKRRAPVFHEQACQMLQMFSSCSLFYSTESGQGDLYN
ncbi:MAG: hypothetical protein LIO55_08260, partial [Oscillospiraceae bacterium]|nr:hypothetical protein [Oscillospiraceae bacterium]